MSTQFKHEALNLVQKTRIVFTAFSKRNFYLRSAVSQYVLVQGHTPINPFMNVDYNLAGLVPKDSIRISNNTLIARADEMWVFGEISDGVLMEIYIAAKQGKLIRYFQPTLTGDDFREVDVSDVRLEDVSPWMWEWVQTGKSLERWHPRLRFTKTYPLIYPAYSKRNFFLQMHISQFCLNQHTVPLNPFMLFRYFLGDSVPRDTVYRSNNNIVALTEEIWVFGEISDGVLAEIKLKREQGHTVRYYKIIPGFPVTFRRVPGSAMPFEDEALEEFRHLLV
jgi:hypothetical protein